MVMSDYPSPPWTQHRENLDGSLSNGSTSEVDRSQMPDPVDKQSASDSAPAINSDSSDDDRRIKFEEWGFNIDRLFEVAYRFYKRNESKAFHPSFDERNQMNALIMQARYGNHDGGKAPDVGVLDLVGKRRQYEWSLLNGMSKTEAMTKFICTLDEICPIFKAHAEAVKISSSSNGGPRVSGGTSYRPNGQTGQNQDSKLSETNAQLQSIYTSLCKQTHDQFKKYAEKQHPSDPAQQKYLINSLQEQYYQQYISQMHPELKGSLPNSSQASSGNISSGNIPSPSMPSPSPSSELSTTNEVSSTSNMNVTGQPPHAPTAAAAQLVAAPIEPQQAPSPALTPIVDTQTRPGDQRSILNVAEPSPSHQQQPPPPQQTNLVTSLDGENNVEADISCEELNSEMSPLGPCETNEQETPRATINLLEIQSTTTSQPPQAAVQVEGRKDPQEASRKPVKSYHHTEMPRIGAFESFPQPKLIQKPSQRTIPIDHINPNLPTLPPPPPELERDDGPCKEPAVSPPEFPAESEPTHGSTNREVTHTLPPIAQLQSATYISMAAAPASQAGDLVQSSPIQAEATSQPPLDQRLDQTDGQGALYVPYDAPTEGAQSLQQMPPPPPEWGNFDETEESPAPAPVYEPLEPATIWTKRAVAEFKDSLGGDKQGGVYEIKESALVIIQVPTYPDGRYIYWEFATDDYDIGFGLDFVYEKNLAHPLALNIYEDNDDDDLEDLIDGDGWQQTTPSSSAALDPEYGHVYGDHHQHQYQPGALNERDKLISEKRRRVANTISILPTYRRDSHEEVFVGRHKYPGQGYYLLRFDNTYSVLRSKTLYFRICYFI